MEQRVSTVRRKATKFKSHEEIVNAELLMQSLSLLPPLSIPVFKGDPLDYQFFIRAFEHGIEDRTENNKDRL